jgi:3-hydroxyacyl-CoA dehydrogenase / enoyl-CoA hydratase / 3-hydroxybutyryl-CoA epimerase
MNPPNHPPVTHDVDADGVGWMVFDAPESRANIFNPATQAAMHAVLDALATAAIRALVIIGAKDRIFIAGADLHWLAGLPDVATAADFSQNGQRLFARVANFRVPVVCAIHGACAGGGCELALACDWRIASDAPATQIGLPETSLGTIPGWGGCARLPRLIGAEAALDHILKAQLRSAAEARKSGLVDEVVAATELRARAKAMALQLAAHGRPNRPAPPTPAPTFFSHLHLTTEANTRGHQPALLAAIDAVEQNAHGDVAASLEAEALAFGAVTAGPVCKNLLRVFFLKEAAKKRTFDGWFPARATKSAPVKRVGVVGAGVMGSGIAQWLAVHGFDVVLRDVQPEFVERGLGVARRLSDEAVRRGKLTASDASAALGRIAPTTAWDGFDACELVIEAIVENVAAKQKLFTELAGVVGPATLLASNSSALPIEEIAGHVPHPERTLGLHFFNPVSRMPLVELIIGRHTSAAAAARALTLVQTLGKSPVICRSSPGFLVTRVLFFYLNDAVRLWEQGTSAEAIDEALVEFGWPMGPLRLIDEVGVDVTNFIFAELAHYFPARFARTATCGAMLAAGLQGRKNGAGRGFYRYDSGVERSNEREILTLPGIGDRRPPGREAFHPPAEISDSLLRVMIAEAERCLAEGVVRTPDDVDFALLTGAGFPAFRGGLMSYARGLSPPVAAPPA